MIISRDVVFDENMKTTEDVGDILQTNGHIEYMSLPEEAQPMDQRPQSEPQTGPQTDPEQQGQQQLEHQSDSESEFTTRNQILMVEMKPQLIEDLRERRPSTRLINY